MAYPSAADLEAANDALIRLAEVPIASFADGSKPARVISALYPRVRALMFGALDWGFATAKLALTAPVAAVPPWLWEYALPDGVVQPRYVQSADGTVLGPKYFEQGVRPDDSARVLWCDLNPVTLVYTREIIDPLKWDADFYSAFTLQLAAEIALPITGKPQLAQAMAQSAARAIAAARAPQTQAVTVAQGPSTTELARMI